MTYSFVSCVTAAILLLAATMMCAGQNSLDSVDLADTSNIPAVVTQAIKACGSIRNLIDGGCPPNPNQKQLVPGKELQKCSSWEKK